jgi:hypothetical protein
MSIRTKERRSTDPGRPPRPIPSRPDPATATPTETPTETTAAAARRPKLPLGTRAAVGALGAVGLLIAGFLWLVPYERGLTGSLDGRSTLVESSCPVPVVAALSSPGDHTLLTDGTWAAGDPPCQRTAGFRVGLGAVVAVICGGWAWSVARRGRATSAMAEPGSAAAA